LIFEIIKKKYKSNYLKWSEDKKIDFLSTQLKNKKKIINNNQFRNKENKEMYTTYKIRLNKHKE